MADSRLLRPCLTPQQNKSRRSGRRDLVFAAVGTSAQPAASAQLRCAGVTVSSCPQEHFLTSQTPPPGAAAAVPCMVMHCPNCVTPGSAFVMSKRAMNLVRTLQMCGVQLRQVVEPDTPLLCPADGRRGARRPAVREVCVEVRGARRLPHDGRRAQHGVAPPGVLSPDPFICSFDVCYQSQETRLYKWMEQRCSCCASGAWERCEWLRNCCSAEQLL